MKKLLALTLTGLMLTGLATTAFAAETNNGTAGTGIDVKGNYVQGAPERTQISADIVWDAMEFTYFDGYPTWNPGTHDYENANYEKGWSTDTKNITVTNRKPWTALRPDRSPRCRRAGHGAGPPQQRGSHPP